MFQGPEKLKLNDVGASDVGTNFLLLSVIIYCGVTKFLVAVLGASVYK